MKLIIHIGPPKTGSTSIQKSLSKDRERLKGLAIYFFDEPNMLPRALPTLYSKPVWTQHPQLLKKFGSPEDVLAWSEGCWTRFEQEVDAEKPELAIISSEGFSHVARVDDMFARLRKRFDEIYVLAYVRDPADFYVSWIQQRIKGGLCLGELVPPRDFEYKTREVLERYASVADRDHMIVRNFARTNLADGDVIADLSAVMSRIGPDCSVNPVRANESVPAAGVAWLLGLNEQAAYSKAKRNATAQRKAERFSAKSGYSINQMKALSRSKKVVKLKIGAASFAEVIRYNNREECRWINETFLQDQEKLTLVEDMPETSDQAADIEGLRDWILGHVQDEGMVEVLRAVVRLPEQGKKKKNRKKAKA